MCQLGAVGHSSRLSPHIVAYWLDTIDFQKRQDVINPCT